MSSTNFARSLARVLAYEGGFTKNSKDPGNWTGGKVGKGKLVGTKKGIAASSHPTLDIPNLTDAQIATIYRGEYWTPSGCDALPDGCDLVVMDASVNSGRARSLKWYAAGKDAVAPKTKIQKACAARLAFLRGLSTFATFGKGWTTRVANVEATAVSWALAASGMTPAAVKGALAIEADKAVASKVKAKSAATSSAGAAATGSAASSALPHDAVISPDLWPYAVAAVLAALAVAVAVYAYRAHVHGQRANAYKEAAANV